MNERYIKIGAAGAELPADAGEWVAVEDTLTGLTWAVETIAVKDWSAETEATVAAELAASRVAGIEGWRIPTRAELVTLVDDTRYDPAIDVEAFPNCASDWFWTSTKAAPSPGDCAWIVGFYYGLAYWGNRGDGGFVRAVCPSR